MEACLKRFDSALAQVEEAQRDLDVHQKVYQELLATFKVAVEHVLNASAAMAEIEWDTGPLKIIDQRIEAAEEREQKRKREN